MAFSQLVVVPDTLQILSIKQMTPCTALLRLSSQGTSLVLSVSHIDCMPELFGYISHTA